MITKTIQTLNGNLRIKIPTDLTEITIGQMIAMEKAEDNSIPLIPGLTKDVCDNITNYSDLQMIDEYIQSLAHKIRYCFNEKHLPEHIIIGTKKVKRFGFVFEKENKIKVIKNLSIEPAGAYLASRDIIADEINRHINLYGEENYKDNFAPSIDACANLLAHYFYCPATGLLYNEQKAEAFKEEILKLSMQAALPIARFFFLRFPDLSQQKVSLWQAVKQTWKRKRVLHRLKHMAVLILLILWLLAMCWNGIIFVT